MPSATVEVRVAGVDQKVRPSHGNRKTDEFSLLEESVGTKSERQIMLERAWIASTQDNNIPLYGFRRFKTLHLFSLRLLESEIDPFSNKLYQGGLKVGSGPTSVDRLGLKHCKVDKNALSLEEAFTEEEVLRLESVLQRYGDAVARESKIMGMETSSMLDDDRLDSYSTNLSLFEKHKTRLVRVDLAPRNTQDPFQRSIHKVLRWIRYRRYAREAPTDEEEATPNIREHGSAHVGSLQNTVILAAIIWRFLVAILAIFFVVVPLAILTNQTTKKSQLITISAWIVAFTFPASLLFKASNQSTLSLVAAYAAVLAVFISNGPNSWS